MIYPPLLRGCHSPALGPLASVFPFLRRLGSRTGPSELGAQGQPPPAPPVPSPLLRDDGAPWSYLHCSRPLPLAPADGGKPRAQSLRRPSLGLRRGLPRLSSPVLVVRGVRVVLVLVSAFVAGTGAAGLSRELEHPSGAVHRGGELIALEDNAREELVRPCVHACRDSRRNWRGAGGGRCTRVRCRSVARE